MTNRAWKFKITNEKTNKVSTFYGEETPKRSAEQLIEGVLGRVRDETPIKDLPNAWIIQMNIVEDPVWDQVPVWNRR